MASNEYRTGLDRCCAPVKPGDSSAPRLRRYARNDNYFVVAARSATKGQASRLIYRALSRSAMV